MKAAISNRAAYNLRVCVSLKNEKKYTIIDYGNNRIFSCKQGSKSTPDNVEKSSVYTKHEYTDSTGSSLIIQNSLPKVV